MKISTVIQGSPKGFDVAFASIDRMGTPGKLNQFVLEELGIDQGNLPKSDDLKLGFFQINNLEYRCPVTFIVTIGSNSSDLLKINFEKALFAFRKDWKNKRIWIPLMGVGVGGLDFKSSFDIIFKGLNDLIIKENSPSEVVISIPREADNKTIKSIRDTISVWGEYSQLESEVSEKEEINDQNGTIDQISENKEYYTKKFNDIIQSKEFYFQKTREVLNELKSYEAQLNTEKDPLKKTFSTLYGGLLGAWSGRGSIIISEFTGFLKRQQAYLIPLFELICKFLSYIDERSWYQQNINDDKNNRFIAKSSVDQSTMITQFLEYATNNFKLVPEHTDHTLYRAIEFLQNPQLKFNILSETHIKLISKHILKKEYTNDEFHSRLNDYFNAIGFPLLNPENATFLYTNILYDESIRKLWDVKVEQNNTAELSIDDIQNENNSPAKDKIPFHLDQVVSEDKLGREPVAKAFVNLIKKDVFTEKLDHSFMVHLQGEWGAGKSSFLNFIKKNLNSDGEHWIVVNYNAWQNQHISPPWWTLIDQIYRQSKSELSWWCKCGLWKKENYRRVIWYSGWQKILALVLTIAFTILLVAYGSAILEILTHDTISSTDIDNQSKGLTIDVFAKLLITLSSVIGVIYSFSKFISTPFFMKSSKEAISFISRASDPMSKIKTHFSDLIDNINSKKEKRQLAIFIDDIDRCNKEYIVQLLEGIQTLFKEKRVLYIVAGEKKWITTSFGNTYKEFSSDPKKSDELGELFLEKAFQLSFRMPNAAEKAKKEYWNYILGIAKNDVDKKIDTIDQLSEDKQKEVKEAITNKEEDIADPVFMKNMEDKFNLSADTVSNLVIEEKNSDSEEIQHLLKDFHTIIDPNPRSIIRLANNYTMIRSTLIAERKDVSADKIFRWLVIEDLYPKIKLTIKGFNTIADVVKHFEENIPEGKVRDDCTALLQGDKNIKETEFKMEEIKNIIGL